MAKIENDRLTIELPGFEKKRPGRVKTSPLTPQEQNAKAQKTRRARMTNTGYVWRGFWFDDKTCEALSLLKSRLKCESKDEALARLLSIANNADVIDLLLGTQSMALPDC